MSTIYLPLTPKAQGYFGAKPPILKKEHVIIFWQVFFWIYFYNKIQDLHMFYW
jgi:hypothetical protein